MNFKVRQKLKETVLAASYGGRLGNHTTIADRYAVAYHVVWLLSLELMVTKEAADGVAVPMHEGEV